MSDIELESAKTAKPGDRIYRHKVQFNRQKIVEQIAEVYVVSASEEFDEEEVEEILESIGEYDWDDVHSWEEDDGYDILATDGITAGRCPHTPDMFKKAG